MKTTLPAKLNSLKPGQSATIQAIHAEEALMYRLTAMGFKIGKRIELIRKGLGRGPLQVRLGMTDVIIRNRDAAHIDVYPAVRTEGCSPGEASSGIDEAMALKTPIGF